jgi:hypothetical protein
VAAAIPTPEGIDAAFLTGALEDVAPTRPGDQFAGCSAEVARAAALEVAGLHAPTRGDETLRD